MAILPRTLLTQPAAVAVAAVSLFGFTILGTAAQQEVERNRLQNAYTAPCANLEAHLGDRQLWLEADYVRYATCFEDAHDPRSVVEVAGEGIARYPRSQTLYNLKGFHEIRLREHASAARTLEDGLRAVGEPTNGVMENNLAWSYLWMGEGGTDVARALYKSAMKRSPRSCEILHTGLFVEFEIARHAQGLEQAEALRNFQNLRTVYQVCENRDAAWDTLVESAGAAVLDAEVERLLETPWDQHGMGLTMRVTATSLRTHHGAHAVPAICREAMPLGDLVATCKAELRDAVAVTLVPHTR